MWLKTMILVLNWMSLKGVSLPCFILPPLESPTHPAKKLKKKKKNIQPAPDAGTHTQKYNHPTGVHFTKSIFQKLGSSVFADTAFGGLLQSQR